MKVTNTHTAPRNRALYNVLVILLRRPLIVEHQDTSTEITQPFDMAYESFSACLTSATEIVTILRLYKRYYSSASAPYLLSYAAYICTTILVRLIALGRDETNARQSLATCLEALERHTRLYKAASRTKVAISVLIQRLGASIELPGTHENQAANAQLPSTRPEPNQESEHLGPTTSVGNVQHGIEQDVQSVSQSISLAHIPEQVSPPFTSTDSPDQNALQQDLSIDWLVGTGVDREAVIQSFATNGPTMMQEDSLQYFGDGQSGIPGGDNSGSSLGGPYLDFESMNSYIVSEFQGILQ